MSNIFTVDGPAASGKSSAGGMLADMLGYKFLDSGSIYRAGCVYLRENGLPTEDDKANANVFGRLDIQVSSDNRQYLVFVDGRDVTRLINTEDITALVPKVGGRWHVREAVKRKQHEMVFGTDTVVTGRDVGTEVFPSAQLKFFLTASPEVRAERRTRQMQAEGLTPNFSEILRRIIERDSVDMTRDVSPFRQPTDAVVIDTSALSLDEVVRRMNADAHGIIEGQIAGEGIAHRRNERR